MPWGLIDRSGRPATEFQYGFANSPREGFAAVTVSGKSGCITVDGTVVIPPVFDQIVGFHDGLSGVCVGGRWGIINRAGKLVVPAEYEFIFPFSEGLAGFETKGGSGFMDKEGCFRVPPVLKSTRAFAGGLAVVSFVDSPGDLWFIDRNGNRKFGPFIDATDFADGLAVVLRRGKKCYELLDDEGRVVLELDRGVRPQGFSEGLSAAEDLRPGSHGGYGYIDRTGAWVVAPRFEFAGLFANGCAVVTVDGGRGLLLKSGRFLARPEYEYLANLQEGRACFGRDSKYGYLDDKGEVTIAAQFSTGQEFREGFAAVRRDD